MAETLTSLPAEFAAGTTVIYRRTFVDYPASAYTMKLYLAGANVLEVDTVADGDVFVVTIPADRTKVDFAPGHYRWAERVDDGAGNIYEPALGAVKITPNLAEGAEGDHQEWVEKSITALKAHIEGRLETGMESYSIAGRAVSRIPIKEAIGLLNTLESRLARMESPDTPTRPILCRFTGTGYDR